jgi:hypothetical protein
MTVASQVEQLGSVEQWARSRGLWAHHNNPAPRGWRVSASDGGMMLVMLQSPTMHEPAPFWTVSPSVALAWALLVETNTGLVDIGRCLTCNGRGSFWWDGEDAHPPCMVECSRCNGNGRETIPAARLLLDVATSNRDARDVLHAHADQLLANGDPAGMALAWGLRWSAGDDEQDGTGEAVMLLHWATVARKRAELSKSGADTAEALSVRTPFDYWTCVEIVRLWRRTWVDAGGPTLDEFAGWVIRFGLGPVRAIIDSSAGRLDAWGHSYIMPGGDLTTRQRVDALNAQGGPTSFSVADDEAIIAQASNGDVGLMTWRERLATLTEEPVAPTTRDARSRPTASRIGRQLGRRLGVRR